MFLFPFKGTIRKSFSGRSSIYSFDPAQLLVSQRKADKRQNPAEKKTVSFMIVDLRLNKLLGSRVTARLWEPRSKTVPRLYSVLPESIMWKYISTHSSTLDLAMPPQLLQQTLHLWLSGAHLSHIQSLKSYWHVSTSWGHCCCFITVTNLW